MALIKCKVCKAQISTDAERCPYCGKPQVVFTKCEECGKEINTEAESCPSCGNPLEQSPVYRDDKILFGCIFVIILFAVIAFYVKDTLLGKIIQGLFTSTK